MKDQFACQSPLGLPPSSVGFGDRDKDLDQQPTMQIIHESDKIGGRFGQEFRVLFGAKLPRFDVKLTTRGQRSLEFWQNGPV
jgi:hypothetical protein